MTEKMKQNLLNLFDLFPQKSIINLPERTDRRAELCADFVRLGIDADQHGFEFFPAFQFSTSNGFSSPSVRGCFASHLACLKKAIACGHTRVRTH
jgi:glycosyl transferase family 25